MVRTIIHVHGYCPLWQESVSLFPPLIFERVCVCLDSWFLALLEERIGGWWLRQAGEIFLCQEGFIDIASRLGVTNTGYKMPWASTFPGFPWAVPWASARNSWSQTTCFTSFLTTFLLDLCLSSTWENMGQSFDQLDESWLECYWAFFYCSQVKSQLGVLPVVSWQRAHSCWSLHAE